MESTNFKKENFFIVLTLLFSLLLTGYRDKSSDTGNVKDNNILLTTVNTSIKQQDKNNNEISSENSDESLRIGIDIGLTGSV